jgi:hypothetical protein
MMFAIILMNTFNPLIDRGVRQFRDFRAARRAGEDAGA